MDCSMPWLPDAEGSHPGHRRHHGGHAAAPAVLGLILHLILTRVSIALCAQVAKIMSLSYLIANLQPERLAPARTTRIEASAISTLEMVAADADFPKAPA